MSFARLAIVTGAATLWALPASADVLCRKPSGAVVVRETCKKKETALDLSQFGLAGPPGPPGAPGAKGDKGDPGGVGTVEAFHEVGGAGQPAFQGNWHNEGFGRTTTAFFLDPFGVVHLKGRAANGTAAQLTIFTLPDGYRPAAEHNFAPLGCGGVLTIAADGNVQVINSTFTCDLDGITFHAGS